MSPLCHQSRPWTQRGKNLKPKKGSFFVIGQKEVFCFTFHSGFVAYISSDLTSSGT